MDSINSATTNPSETVIAPAQPAEAQSPTSPAVKQQIAAARNTKVMLENFISALDRVTLNGDYAVKFGIGYEFLNNVLRQTTADIKRLQDEAK